MLSRGLSLTHVIASMSLPGRTSALFAVNGSKAKTKHGVMKALSMSAEDSGLALPCQGMRMLSTTRSDIQGSLACAAIAARSSPGTGMRQAVEVIVMTVCLCRQQRMERSADDIYMTFTNSSVASFPRNSTGRTTSGNTSRIVTPVGAGSGWPIWRRHAWWSIELSQARRPAG